MPHSDFSPFLRFTRAQWAQLRADTPLTLNDEDLARLRSIHDPISLDEVETIYLPLSRLLAMYVAAKQELFHVTGRFLGNNGHKTPFIIGIAGSVAVGKSTTSRILRALLERWQVSPRVELITTDGFLYPNSVLEAEGIMNRKGFPESYHQGALVRFLADIKAGKPRVAAPVYSHHSYDIVQGAHNIIDQPDILIVEGLNVLQLPRTTKELRNEPIVSDFFDFSIFMDADDATMEQWYIDRFMNLRETAFRDPSAYFHRFAEVSQDEAALVAKRLWRDINLVNLRENIRPTRPRAQLILTKGTNHAIEQVELRKV